MIFPKFLFLLLLIPIPIILHFITKRLLQKKDFPSLIFILKSDSRLLRWFFLRRLFLLLLRIGIILSLVLAFSNLLIPVSFIDPAEKIILDHSLSMKEINAYTAEVDVLIPNKGGVSLIQNVLKNHPTGVLISDAQKSNFKELLNKDEKYPGINLNKISLPRENIGIIGHQIGPAFMDAEIDFVFTVLKNFDDSRNVLFSLYIDEKIIKQKEVTLNQKINEIKFNINLSKGIHKGYLELNYRDGFAFDNIYYFSFFVNPVIKVTIYSKEYPERLIASLDPSYFLVDWKEEFSKKINGDIFIIDDYPFEEVLRNNGDSIPGIVCFKDVLGSSYAKRIPYRFSKIVNVSNFYPLKDLPELSDVPIRYNSKLIRGKKLLCFDNGDAFLARENNTIFLPLSLKESDLSLYPIYIPFLYKLILYICGEDYSRNLLMDQKIVLEIPFNPIIYSPDNKEYIPLSLGDNKYLFTNAENPGIYEIRDRLKLMGYISINPDPAESYLDTLSLDEIEILFGKIGYNNGATLFLIVGLLLFILSVIIERK